jgi:hypothetical protein
MGQAPSRLEDAASNPLPLAMTYGAELTFAGPTNTRNLTWTQTGLDSRASVAVDSSKIASALQGSTTATVEVVLDIDAVTSNISRISHIGSETESGRLSLAADSVDKLRFFFNTILAGEWDIDLPTAGRVVVHVVIDTTLTTPAHRALMYADGIALNKSGGNDLTQNAAIDLSTGRHYVLGNREIGGRTFQGSLHYAAMYSAAFTNTEVTRNAKLLADNDDSP